VGKRKRVEQYINLNVYLYFNFLYSLVMGQKLGYKVQTSEELGALEREGEPESSDDFEP
jgi:hypothetical protein